MYNSARSRTIISHAPVGRPYLRRGYPKLRQFARQLYATRQPQPTATPAAPGAEQEDEGGEIVGPLAGGIVGAIAVASTAAIGLRMKRSRMREQQRQ